MPKLLLKIARRLGLKPEPTYTVTAVVHRADGTTEDLGVISKGKGTFTPAMNDIPKER